MSTAVSGKRKSPELERDEEPATTPSNSPARKKLKITQHQKQALIDNLQLEITERARRLRAQYALQAQDLRSRIQRRVNRIPIALRKTTMGALLEKYTANQTNSPKKSAVPPKAKRPTPSKTVSRGPEYPPVNVLKSPSRRTQDTSNGGSYSDKENAPVADTQHIPLENPKKRGNPNASGQPRSVSQVLRDAESKVLSPKSSNSRTYKQSPLIASPTKSSYLSRPTSPLKPSSPLKAMIEDARARNMRTETKKMTSPATVRKTGKATSTTTSQTKRTAPKSANPVPVKSPGQPSTRHGHSRNISSSTSSSTMSTGTTIVSKSTRGNQRATGPTSSAAAKRTAAFSRSQGPAVTATAKRTAARKAGTELSASTGRVLRKRV